MSETRSPGLRPLRCALILLAPLLVASCAMPAPQPPARPSLHQPLRADASERPSPRTDDAPSTPVRTLEQTIDLGAESNPALRAEYARFEALLLNVPQASSLPDPMAEVSQMETFPGRGDMRENMIGVSQTFPWFGKRGLRGTLAEREALEALEVYRASFLDFRQETVAAWHWLAYEKADRALTLQDRALLEESLEATATLYDTGRLGRDALLKAQTEIARVENALPEFEARIAAREQQLRRLTGARGATFEPVAFDEQPAPSLLPHEAQVFEAALEHRPELERVARQIDQGELARRLARADYYPDFTLGLGYVAMGDRPGSPFVPVPEDRADAWRASVGINLPLPNARRRAAREQAEKQVEEATFRLEQTENEILEELAATHARLRALERQLSVLRETILPLAEEAHEAAQVAYETGRSDYLDLLDAQRTYIAVRRDLLQAERDRRLALADLERAAGLPLEWIESPPENAP